MCHRTKFSLHSVMCCVIAGRLWLWRAGTVLAVGSAHRARGGDAVRQVAALSVASVIRDCVRVIAAISRSTSLHVLDMAAGGVAVHYELLSLPPPPDGDTCPDSGPDPDTESGCRSRSTRSLPPLSTGRRCSRPRSGARTRFPFPASSRRRRKQLKTRAGCTCFGLWRATA